MSAARTPRAGAGAFVRRHLYDLARLLLAAWALGLVIVAVQLGTRRQEMTRTLMQLQDDAQFRARAQHREAVDPEWYRRKALTLLAATESLQRNAAWTVFVPGSWHRFDDLDRAVGALHLAGHRGHAAHAAARCADGRMAGELGP